MKFYRKKSLISFKQFLLTFFSLTELKDIPPGDLTERKNLRNRLKCKSFDWYLRNIYPESTMLLEYIGFGEVKDDFCRRLTFLIIPYCNFRSKMCKMLNV